MVLDSRFFQRCATTDHKGQMLESYKAVYARSTMVLFSRKSKTPLAALTLKADDVGCLSMLTSRPSPKNATEPYFQGMLNMPNQKFTFTISNLSGSGMINFNILHTPRRVSEVNPGPSYGINEVNELHKSQSYTIEADQRNSRAMLLAGKTKTVRDPDAGEKQVDVSVKESELGETPTGLYFYLSVVPDKACKSLVDQFAEGTTWKVVPGFVRRMPKPIYRAPGAYSYGSTRERSTEPLSSFAGGGARFGGGGPMTAMESRESELSAYGPSLRQQARPIARHFWGHGTNSVGGRRGAAASAGYRNGHRLGASSAAGGRRGAAAPARERAGPRDWRGSNAAGGRGGSVDFSRDRAGPRGSQERSYRSAPAMYLAEPVSMSMMAASSPSRDRASPRNSNALPAPSAARSESLTAMFAAAVDVGTTQAAELKYGEQVHVHSSETGHDYAYEHCSEPTVLCLSIWNDMKFLPLPDIQKELDEEVEEWKQNEGKALIESLNAVYKTDTCVIDLESEADTIICTCGHQCIHHSNVQSSLRKCPVCRSFITAFVRADGILVD